MSEMYRSISVPVKAQQFNGEHPKVVTFYTRYRLDGYGDTEVDIGDWIVEFATGEIHVVRDTAFNLRFEKTNDFTKKELSAAVKMALEGDCV